VLASVAVTLGAAEIGLQLADYPPSVFSPWIRDPSTGYRYAPSLATRMKRPKEYDVAFATNSLGFRDDEVAPKHGPRILMLGDSFASGYGIERGEMFADVLERDLGVEIVNAAVGGFEMIHQARWFAAHGRDLAPDLVVYVVYLGNDLSRNDEWQVDTSGALVSPDREFPVRRPYELKLLALYKSFRYRRKIAEEQQRGDWVPKPDYLTTAERELSDEGKKDYADVESLLGRLRDDVRASGAELFVVLVPYRTMVDRKERDRFAGTVPGFDSRYDLDLPAERTGAILDRLGVRYFDLSPALRAHFDEGGTALYFPVDGHLNAAGNALVARVLEPVLAPRVAAVRQEKR
jgi:lysophospholipase L1-like esterase